MAEEVLLGGQRVLPHRAEMDGFKFNHPGLDDALAHGLSR
jgi:NAD dependent epimerase/dehydratase family enzyme